MLLMRTYAVLSACLMLSICWLPASAQVLYTDISPDKVLSAADGTLRHDYGIDLDQDGKIDFKLTHRVSSSLTILTITCNTDSLEEIVLTENGNSATALEAGDEIGALSPGSWLNTAIKGNPAILTMSDLEGSPWYGVQDKYLGLAVKTAAGWQYGWIRLDVAPVVTSATVKDFAVQLTPDTPIKAGDKGTSPVVLPDSPVEDIRVTSTGQSATVLLPEHSGEGHMSLFSVLGVPVGRYELTSQWNVIPLNNLTHGVYLALVQTRTKTAAKLIAIQ